MQKVLAYLSGHDAYIHFGILKKLQKKIPLEVYAIIDLGNQPKKFFENQEFVKFEKIWHYRDYVKPFHKPDIKYLKKIEKKFNINLWEIAYSDPTFFAFEGTSNFQEDEILSLIEDDCKLFENIFEKIKPDFLMTHTGGQKQMNILREMCISKQVKILQRGSAKFGIRGQISQEYDVLDEFSETPQIKLDEKLNDGFLYEMNKEINSLEYYKKVSNSVKNKKISFAIKTFSNYSKIKKESNNLYTTFKDQNTIIKNFKLFKKNYNRMQRKKFLDKNSIKEIPKNEKFVIFPLHMQPEHTTSVVTPFFTDQITLIRNIARSLPVNYFLYVKEHPSMGTMRYWRDLKYYKKILDIPNVRFVHPDINSLTLYKKSQIILTINGSASTEAIMIRKPVIVFNNVAGVELDTIKKVGDLENMPTVIRKTISEGFSEKGCKRFFVQKLNETYGHLPSLSEDIQKKLFSDGVLVQEVTIQKVKDIIEKNDADLKIVVDEYIRKIIQWEKFEKSKIKKLM